MVPEVSAATRADLFGASRMGYVLIESEHLDRWRQLLKDGLGLHLAGTTPASLAFRVDEHCRRIMIRRGSAEDVIAAGWHLRDRQTLDEMLARLARRGIPVEQGGAAEASERGVEAFWRFMGPKGMAIELFVDPILTDEPLDMLSPGFVTGASGLGHFAITSRLPAQMRKFWEEIFDARYSDAIVERIGGLDLDIDFLRVNERHHSIAIANVRKVPIDPIRTRIQHMNLLTVSLESLSDAFRRCRRLGFEMAHEIGQHPNDKELSFYVISPSGFEIELGWNALPVDEEAWKPGRYQGISLWGHKPQKAGALHKFLANVGNFGRGIRSLAAPEYSPMDSASKEAP